MGLEKKSKTQTQKRSFRSFIFKYINMSICQGFAKGHRREHEKEREMRNEVE